MPMDASSHSAPSSIQRSLALECFDQKCMAKLHTKRCKRTPASTPSYHIERKQAGKTRGNGPALNGHAGGGYNHVAGAGGGSTKQKRGGRSQGLNEHFARLPHQAHQARVVLPPHQPTFYQGNLSHNEQGFPNMTVQPQLEAFMEALMKQQQEFRIALKEVTSQIGTCGVRGSCHSHSNC